MAFLACLILGFAVLASSSFFMNINLFCCTSAALLIPVPFVGDTIDFFLLGCTHSTLQSGSILKCKTCIMLGLIHADSCSEWEKYVVGL